MIFKNEIEQFRLISNSSQQMLTTNIFHDSFLEKINNINIKDYKDDSKPEYFQLSFSEKERSILKDNEKFLLEIIDSSYRGAVEKFLRRKDFYMKFYVIDVNRNQEPMKTNRNNVLGNHIVCINNTLKFSMFNEKLEAINYDYQKELLYKADENLYIGINNVVEPLRFFQVLFIKED